MVCAYVLYLRENVVHSDNLRFLSDTAIKTLGMLGWCYTLSACRYLVFLAVCVPWIRGVVMIWQINDVSYLFCKPQDFSS